MKDKIYLDTNIIIYLYSTDEPSKRQDCLNLIKEYQEIIINIHVLNEFTNIMLKKFKLKHDDVISAISELVTNFTTVSFDVKTIQSAIQISNKYKFSYFDSLMIASALENKCSLFVSEDLQHNQVVDDFLKIINPFK